MARLRHRDVTVFSHALKTLYADARAETLPKRVLGTLRALFACDFASFSLMDLRRGHWHVAALEPVVREWPGPEKYRLHLRDDPAAVHIMRTRTREALKISDFYRLREYRSSRLYAEMFRPVGCDRRLGFAVQNSKPVTLAVTLNRQGPDFSEEDRMLLDLLRDHLLQANALTQTQRLANVVRLEAPEEHGRETFGVGMVELDAAGRVRWLSARAEVLVRIYFPGAGRRLAARRLPDEMECQIKRRSVLETAHGLTPPASAWHQPGPDGKRLKVRLAARSVDGSLQLLLEEEAAATAAGGLSLALGLTAREGEVLHWLAEGLTNWEISKALGNREATVSKHLERVFAKLGVSNRAAAVRIVAEARAGG